MNTKKKQKKSLNQKESTTAAADQKLQNNKQSLAETMLEQDEMGIELVIKELNQSPSKTG